MGGRRIYGILVGLVSGGRGEGCARENALDAMRAV